MLRRERIFVALSSAGAVAVIAYTLLRVAERSFFPEPNPAALIWPSRSSFVWRSWLALYAGGMGGFECDQLIEQPLGRGLKALQRLAIDAVYGRNAVKELFARRLRLLGAFVAERRQCRHPRARDLVRLYRDVERADAGR